MGVHSCAREAHQASAAGDTAVCRQAIAARLDSEGMSAFDYATCSITDGSCMPPSIVGKNGTMPNSAGIATFNTSHFDHVAAGKLVDIFTQIPQENNNNSGPQCVDRPATRYSKAWIEASREWRRGWAEDGVRADLSGPDFYRKPNETFADEDLESRCEVISAYGKRCVISVTGVSGYFCVFWMFG